jgi:hypothetical protein
MAEYGGKKIMGPTSDRGKDQEIDVRDCDFNDRNVAESTGNSYVWAAVTYLDVFQRCQHAWVLLFKNSERDYSVFSTNTTDPSIACGHRYRLPRSVVFQ